MPKSTGQRKAKRPWQDAMLATYEDALSFMEDALRDCPDELWESSMWTVPRPEPWEPLPSPDGTVNNDAEFQERLLQGGSAIWNVAYHALWHLDYDISGGFGSWAPPEPFGNQDGGRVVTRVFTRDELIGYVAWCRRRARETFDTLTDAAAAKAIPAEHRYRGRSYAWLLAGIPRHVTEHAAQIRQFITAAGVTPGASRTSGGHFEVLRAAVTDATDAEIATWAGHFGGIDGVLGMVFETWERLVREDAEDSDVAFVFQDAPSFRFRISGGAGKMSQDDVSDAPATFRSSGADFLRLITGQLAFADAFRTGRVTLEGDEGHLERMFTGRTFNR